MRRIALSLAVMGALVQASAAADFSGSWGGAYECDGVVREMRVDLVAAGGNLYSGMLSFMGATEPGRFAVRGVSSPDGKVLVVEPSGWVDRPLGFSMVGLIGRLSMGTLFGTMSSPQCGGFFAERSSPQ